MSTHAYRCANLDSAAVYTQLSTARPSHDGGGAVRVPKVGCRRIFRHKYRASHAGGFKYASGRATHTAALDATTLLRRSTSGLQGSVLCASYRSDKALTPSTTFQHCPDATRRASIEHGFACCVRNSDGPSPHIRQRHCLRCRRAVQLCTGLRVRC